jgi:hypothetical protein
VPLRHPTDRTTTDRLGQTGDRLGNPAARRCRQPPPPDHVRVAESERYLNYWWYDDGTRLGLDGCLGAADGAVVARALDRVAWRLPDIVSGDGESEPSFFEGSLETRRADALVALCSQRIAGDADADRATVVVHAPLAAVAGPMTPAARWTAVR